MEEPDQYEGIGANDATESKLGCKDMVVDIVMGCFNISAGLTAAVPLAMMTFAITDSNGNTEVEILASTAIIGTLTAITPTLLNWSYKTQGKSATVLGFGTGLLVSTLSIGHFNNQIEHVIAGFLAGYASFGTVFATSSVIQSTVRRMLPGLTHSQSPPRLESNPVEPKQLKIEINTDPLKEWVFEK
jgi:hypothetical protein